MPSKHLFQESKDLFPRGSTEREKENSTHHKNIVVSDIRFFSSSKKDKNSGLLGWASFILNNHLRVEGIGLRRTRKGKMALSFPARRDSKGNKHFFFRPLNNSTRRELETQVFQAFELEEESQ